MHRTVLIILLVVTFSCSSKEDLPITLELQNGWEFKNTSESKWYPANVPGEVHSDLINNNLIEDPFIGNNEQDIQWVSDTNWEYKKEFSLNKKELQKKNIRLNFDGLDTYASVYLNDSLILKTNNAFRMWQVDVKSIIKAKNEIRILFVKTSIFEENEKDKLGYSLPEGNRIFTRKAQFQYGWDWGPKLNTSGIWRPITLTVWNNYLIENVNIIQEKLTDSIANLTIEIEENSLVKDQLNYEVYINNSKEAEFPRPEKPEIPISIKNPKRWWPHNLGEPYLYNFKIVVRKGKTILDTYELKKGLRTIDLVTEKDSIGESFYFKVNNESIYAKGANYIPQNSMQNRVTDADYENILDDVVEANMNMLRVWGGGIYENDIFYDLCDEKGILVWQDFMFACAMYPGDDTFLDNVQQEAIDNVKRLRNHSSIALWCGNNENSEGWHRWGWQEGRNDEEKEEIWTNYLKVFDSILPNTVSKLTDTDYWESSPKYGRGNSKYEFEGDAHDWWIWHDAFPFEHLEEHVPRFMSEFGFQSFPSYDVINYINQNNSLDLTSKGFKNHQKHVRGFQLIDDYMKRDFPVQKLAEDYVYMSQLLQAYGITKGIEAQRRAKPYNMGTLFWQLNDCWPAVSWSSIDFYGNWKALQYKAKRSFNDLLITFKVENDILKTYLINDDMEMYTGDLSITILDFSGKIIWNSVSHIKVASNSSEVKHELDFKTIQFKKDEVVVKADFNNTTSYFYLVKPKDLKLQQGDIKHKITKTSEGFQIELSANILQKDVFLYCNESGHYSDNYFDILPHETKTIDFKTDSETITGFQIKTFNKFIR
jgi:beta-mannosidase